MSIPSWIEIVEAVKTIEAGRATSSIKMVYGCGHIVFVTNGNAMYHTCPYCFYTRKNDG